MISIAEHIEYLLMHHDCVVVPGWGAFLANNSAAYFDDRTGYFMPPSRSIGFNPELKHNDGLLVGSISRKEEISLDAARVALDNEVSSLRHQLELVGEMPLGNLGMLFRGDTPETPLFEPSTDSYAVNRFSGLLPLSIKPLVEEQEVADGAVVAESEPTARIITIPTPLKIVASVIIVMVCMGILYSTTSLVHGPQVNFASLDTGFSSHVESTVALDTFDESNLSREIILNIAMPADKGAVHSVQSPSGDSDMSQASAAATYRFNDGDRYLLVVASLPSYSSALKHINGNPDLRVIEMDGNYRVYIATASTIGAARAKATEISATYPNVWVCRR